MDDKPKSIAYIEFRQTQIATELQSLSLLDTDRRKRVVWRRNSPPQASLAISILSLGGISEL